MRKLCLAIGAAAVVAIATPAAAQLSTAASRKAEQPVVETSGTLHDHVERAERVVKQLLEQRAAETNESNRSSHMIAVERKQLERLQTELGEIDAASNDASKLGTHVASARTLADTLANQPVAASAPAGSADVVVVDRNMLKSVRDQIESIEKLAKDSSRHEKR